MKNQFLLLTVFKLLLALFPSRVHCGVITANLILDDNQVGVSTDYLFNLNVATPLSTSTVIYIDLDPQVGIELPSSLSCTSVAGFSGNPGCFKESGTRIRVECSKRMSNTYPTYAFRVKNVKNPASALSLTTEIQVATYESGNLVDETSGVVVNYRPNPLPSSAATLSVTNPTVGAYSELKVTLKVENEVPADGTIVLYFPKWDDSTLGALVINSMVTAAIVTDCSTPGNSPTCSVSPDFTLTGLDRVIISNAFSNTGKVGSGETIQVSVKNVRNPPTLQPRTTFGVSTADADGNLIDHASDLTLTLTNKSLFSGDVASYVSIEGDTGMGQSGTYHFYYEIGNPIPAGGSLRIKIPGQLSFSSISSLQFSGLTNIKSRVTPTQGSSSDEILLQACFDQYLMKGYGVIFQLKGLKNPTSSSPSSSFEISSFDESGYAIETLNYGLTVQSSAGKLQDVKFYPVDSSAVYEYASVFTVQFKTTSELTKTSSVVIQFDAQSIKEGWTIYSDQLCNITDMDYGKDAEDITCQVFRVQNQIRIEHFSDKDIKGGEEFKFNITDVSIRNPGSVRAQPKVSISTHTGTFKLDRGESDTFSPVPGNLSNVYVTPSSYLTSEQDVEYLFTVSANGIIPEDSFVVINLPEQVKVYNEDLIQKDCSRYYTEGLPMTNFKSPRIDCTVRKQKHIEVVHLFEYGDSIDYPTFSFTMPGLQNPRVTGQISDSFELFIYEDQQMKYPLFNITEGVTVQMLQPSQLAAVEITRETERNNEVGSYYFTIQTKEDAQDGDKLIIKFPNTVQLKGNITEKSECLGNTKQLSNLLNCQQLSNNTISLELNFYGQRRLLSTLYERFTIEVTNIRNPPTTRSSDSFTIRQLTDVNQEVAYQDEDIVVQNTDYYLLKPYQVQVIPGSYGKGVQSEYKVVFRPESVETAMYLHIEIPPEIQVSDADCYSLSNTTSLDIHCVYDEVFNKIIVQDFVPLTYSGIEEEFSFVLGNFTNPPQPIETTSFKVRSYTYDHFLIDGREDSLTLNFECALPCKTCIEGSNTQCASCYNDGITTNAPILFDQFCYAGCPSGSNLQNGVCTPCGGEGCESCGTDVCEKCKTGYQLVNGNCISTEDLSDYYFPYLIAAGVWILLSCAIVLARPQALFIPLALVGLSLVSLALGVYEFILLNNYNLKGPMYMVVAGAFAIPLLIQISFFIVYLVTHRRDQQVKQHFKQYPCVVISALTATFLLSYRCVKLLYHRSTDKFNLSQMIADRNPDPQKNLRVLNIWFSYSTLIGDGVLIAQAVSVLQQSQPHYLDILHLRKVSSERIAISSIIFILVILEFVSGVNRPRWLRRNKVVIGQNNKDYSQANQHSMFTDIDHSVLKDQSFMRDKSVKEKRVSGEKRVSRDKQSSWDRGSVTDRFANAERRLSDASAQRRLQTLQLLKAGSNHLSNEEVKKELSGLIEKEERDKVNMNELRRQSLIDSKRRDDWKTGSYDVMYGSSNKTITDTLNAKKQDIENQNNLTTIIDDESDEDRKSSLWCFRNKGKKQQRVLNQTQDDSKSNSRYSNKQVDDINRRSSLLQIEQTQQSVNHALSRSKDIQNKDFQQLQKSINNQSRIARNTEFKKHDNATRDSLRQSQKGEMSVTHLQSSMEGRSVATPYVDADHNIDKERRISKLEDIMARDSSTPNQQSSQHSNYDAHRSSQGRTSFATSNEVQSKQPGQQRRLSKLDEKQRRLSLISNYEKQYASNVRKAKPSDLPDLETHTKPGQNKPKSIMKHQRRMSDPAVLEGRAHHKLWPTRKVVRFVKHVTEKQQKENADIHNQDIDGYFSDPGFLENEKKMKQLMESTPRLRKFAENKELMLFRPPGERPLGRDTDPSMAFEDEREEAAAREMTFRQDVDQSKQESQHQRNLTGEPYVNRTTLPPIEENGAGRQVEDQVRRIMDPRGSESTQAFASKSELGNNLAESREENDYVQNNAVPFAAKGKDNKMNDRRISEGNSTHFSSNAPVQLNRNSKESDPVSGNQSDRLTRNRSGVNVFYSDKSESSVEDLMDVTPTDFNKQNMRFDGKSKGMRLISKYTQRQQKHQNLVGGELTSGTQAIPGPEASLDGSDPELKFNKGEAGDTIDAMLDSMVGGDDDRPEKAQVDTYKLAPNELNLNSEHQVHTEGENHDAYIMASGPKASDTLQSKTDGFHPRGSSPKSSMPSKQFQEKPFDKGSGMNATVSSGAAKTGRNKTSDGQLFRRSQKTTLELSQRLPNN